MIHERLIRCSCGNCQSMPTATEDICCRQVPEVQKKCRVGCITDHPDFERGCLTRVVLDIARLKLEAQGLFQEVEPNQ